MTEAHHLGLDGMAVRLLQQAQGAHRQRNARGFDQHARYLHQAAFGGHRVHMGSQLLAIAQEGRKLVGKAHGRKVQPVADTIGAASCAGRAASST